MKIPPQPPTVDELLPQLRSLNPEQMAQLLASPPTDAQDRYLHWDKLRFQPCPETLTPELCWLGTKLARRALLKPLPFVDKQQNPFQFGYPEPVLKMLYQIDQIVGGKTHPVAPITPGSRDIYLTKSLIDEAISSSQLEGASTTRRVAREMLRTNRKPRTHSERMIANNYQAMEWVQEHQTERLTPQLIRELHRVVTDGTLDQLDMAGRLRQDQDRVQVVDRAQEAVLHDPPAASELPERLQMLCDFANETIPLSVFMHPVVRAILLHFMLAYDHPFVDGNGRTARALFYWSMAQQGYWLMEYISLSEAIKKAPAQYGYAFLHTETDDNDVTYFIVHQLNGIKRAIAELQKYLGRKTQEFQETVTLLHQTGLAQPLNQRQMMLLEHALKNPGAIYRISEHQHLHQIAYQTARTDLLSLAEEFGLLLKAKEGKSFVFVVPNNLVEQIKKRNAQA